ncbi:MULTISPECIES: hypothetical protein [unclassified Mesorhizobium]|uniref:phage adaptor protein n=1 Tax=unclassified Mesorhizobium TaxID=325217 RepID=UPI001093EC1A|nr:MULTISPECIES: hypothetical protein [unclassified Mesorhizobium]TGS47530.1 hypothetical protein EN825_00735 [Mesorhizobium sp. M8A.F.Ca.ET.182.01.1.1]TGS84180.1 hypothetical protein EN824_07390 [Mesorhizobium sp. M8A.F.Ca.ET.181.01.1.1]
MTILDVVKGAATVLGMDVPTLVYGATGREMVEMQELANVMALEIARAHDWQKLLIPMTFTGNGVSDAFDMPSDYRRMQKTSSLWSSRWLWATTHLTSTDEWLELQVTPIATVNGYWIIFGDQFHIWPVMAASETVRFFYVSNLLVAAGDASKKAQFSEDADSFRLSEDLLKKAIIYRWKENKGLAYEQALDDYQDQLLRCMDDDAGSKPVVSGRAPASWRGKGTAWPGTVTGAA